MDVAATERHEESDEQSDEGQRAEEKKPEHQRREALGHSRGGLTSKIHVSCDGRGRPLSVVVSGGQRHDSTAVEAALDAVRVPRVQRGRPRKRPSSMNLDKGYSYPRCRRFLRSRGIAAMIPERRDQRNRRQQRGRKGGRPVVYDRERYASRNVVERCILSLKRFRRVATRYDKRAVSYQAFVTLAAILLWLRSFFSDTT